MSRLWKLKLKRNECQGQDQDHPVNTLALCFHQRKTRADLRLALAIDCDRVVANLQGRLVAIETIGAIEDQGLHQEDSAAAHHHAGNEAAPLLDTEKDQEPHLEGTEEVHPVIVKIEGVVHLQAEITGGEKTVLKLINKQ